MRALLDKFRELPDYRKNKVRYTNPSEILFLSLLAIMAGSEGYADIALWMKERKREISKFLGRGFIVPAYTTIRNTFLGVDIKAVEKIQEEWIHSISDDKESLTIVSTDGKTMRGSNSKMMNQKARHIVSLFLTDDKLVLAQTEVDDKSNEIPALLKLLDSLELENCVITMDAMHTQKKTLKKIIKKTNTL